MSWELGDENIGTESPYVHWWWEQENPARMQWFKRFDPVEAVRHEILRAFPSLDLEPNSPQLPIFSANVPIPTHAKPGDSDFDPWNVNQVKDKFPTDLPANTVITAIIDTGVALGHRRFRHAGGGTRILAAWQQTATFDEQSYLPFGQELYAKNIDDAVKAHSSDGTAQGVLDEDRFNRSLRLVEPHLVVGHRDLDFRAAHGTHVADLAAGFDPREIAEEDLRAHPMVVVNLPPQSLHGSAGTFLAFWALYGVRRVLHLADAISAANPKTAPAGGFPVVINFSYGMQAGPKNGLSQWELALKSILDARSVDGKAPVRLVMPVGNDNLERCCARAFMGGDGEWQGHGPGSPYDLLTDLTVPWRIQPQDHTSNFVELWTNSLDDDIPPDPREIQLFITPPNGAEAPVPLFEQKGRYATLGNYARVYCRGDSAGQLGFVICVSPTERPEHGKPVAPAGLWKIRLEYKGKSVNAAFHVQSDQAGQQHSRNGRQSYFDHKRYKTHLPNGRWRDSYDYETGAHTDRWPDYWPVQIKGTQNALATTESEEVVVIGGFRISDGRPATYSGTVGGRKYRGDRGMEIMDACYPSEVAPSLFGLLASGSRDGSTVAFRGTSMAAALATRHISIAMREDPGNRQIGTKDWVWTAADDYKTPQSRRFPNPRPTHFKDMKKLKGGVGHVPMPATAGLTRISRT